MSTGEGEFTHHTIRNLATLTVVSPNGDAYQRAWKMSDGAVEAMLNALGKPNFEGIQPTEFITKVRELVNEPDNNIVYTCTGCEDCDGSTQ